ncbi:hypothetical protein FRB96_006759 [Tulasnella sp. 330]|nr:hypothetical protein FRB96_006759 [Tulasnella sp. 330]
MPCVNSVSGQVFHTISNSHSAIAKLPVELLARVLIIVLSVHHAHYHNSSNGDVKPKLRDLELEGLSGLWGLSLSYLREAMDAQQVFDILKNDPHIVILNSNLLGQQMEEVEPAGDSVGS